MKMRLLACVAVICSMASTTAFAIDINGQIYKICHADNINISPGGSYLYARSEINELTFVDRKCLTGGADLMRCPPFASFPNSTLVDDAEISQDDKYIYYFTDLIDMHYSNTRDENGTKYHYGTASKYAHFERIDLSANSSPNQAVFSDKIQIPFQLPTSLYSYLSVYLPVDGGIPNSEYMNKLQDIFNFAYDIHQPLFQIPQRDIWGFINGSGWFLIKADKNYNISTYYDTNNPTIMGAYGTSFTRPLDSLFGKIDAPAIKYGDGGAYVAVSGSIISFSPHGDWRNVTAEEPRVSFINGDEEGRYYGYSTYSSIRYMGSSSRIRDAAQLSKKYTANLPITGVSINEREGILSVTVKPAIPNSEKFQDIANNHYLIDGSTVLKIACGNEQNFTFRQTNIGGRRGIWIDSYVQDPKYPTIIYVHGGPQDNIDVNEPANMYQFRLSFDHHFNVDVVHYGGSRFTFDQSGALRIRGRASLISDARLLEYYIDKIPNKLNTNLRFDSFGAEIYRYMNKTLLSSLHSIILNVPMGSYRQKDNLLHEKINRNIYGDQLFDSGFDRSYFDNSTICNLSKNTLLIVGKTDKNVDAIYDYRNCPGNSGSIIYSDNASHGNIYEMDAINLREEAILNMEINNN